VIVVVLADIDLFEPHLHVRLLASCTFV